MKKILSALAASAAILVSPIAQAQVFAPAASSSTFSGPVTVQKDGSAYNCTLTVVVNTGPNEATDSHGSNSHAHSATATASLSGSYPCADIEINGVGSISMSGSNLTITGLSIVPPISLGTCSGPMTVVWGGNSATPRSITFSSPLSDMNSTLFAKCKVVGTVTQTGGTVLEAYP